MVHRLLSDTTSIPPLDSDIVSDALRFGQALAGVNCLFLGATGAMTALSHRDLARLALDLVAAGEPPVCEVLHRASSPPLEVCPYCSERSASVD
jgi:hypothetical protein